MTSAPDATFTIRRATDEDAGELSTLAAATFALACPPHTSQEDIAAHIAAKLNPEQFAADLATDGTVFYVVEVDGEMVAYAMLVRGSRPNGEIESRTPVELRRIYVSREWQGTGVARALMDRCLFHARTHGYDVMWVGTNEANERALTFYRHKGFEITGTRTFVVGSSEEQDHELARRVDDWHDEEL